VIFVIIGCDGPDGQARRKLHRQAHLDAAARGREMDTVLDQVLEHL